jgi:uncharacterized damage-inducible protein DinB
MENPRAAQIADKLLSEGERTLLYFGGLALSAWALPVYQDGAAWTVQQVLHHLIAAERGLRSMFENVAAGGPGAPADFDIEGYNLDTTAQMTNPTPAALFEHYTAERATTVAFARGLSETQLALRGRHPAMGDSSLEDMLRLMYLHNSAHVKDIKRVLASIQS